MLSITSIISVTIIAIGLLFFGVFISQSGKLTHFINFLIVIYLSYFLWLDNSGLFYTNMVGNAVNPFDFLQEDSLYFRFFVMYTTIILIVFFIGISDRFFRSKSAIFEFPRLILFLHFGGLFTLYRNNFRDIFLAIELVTLTSYVLITFERQNRFSTYAGIQYFILGSLPSAMILIAFGLFYLQGGSIALQDLDMLFNTVTTSSAIVELNDLTFIRNLNTQSDPIADLPGSNWYLTQSDLTFFDIESIKNAIDCVNPINSIRILAFSFLFFNFFFKLTAAPFHIWAPSVYGKGPIASVAFLSIYSKTRIFFLMYKFRNMFLHAFSFITLSTLMVVGLLSIITGILGAFSEKTIKRFFVYSSMGHVGFRLIGFSLGTIEGSIAAFHYLFIYILSSFVMWFRLLSMGRDKQKLVQLSSLKHTNPVLSLVFAFLVFSRSGIPPFAGFFIKLDILAATMDSSHFFVTYFLFFCTVVSFFYYLRLIKIMFFDDQVHRDNNAITFSNVYSVEYPINLYRAWVRAAIIIFLGCYMLVMHKPMFMLESQILSSLF